MAGMLPGVECARRRRSGGWADSPARAVQGRSRRSSFCLYASKINSSNSSSLSMQRSTAYKAYQDDKLGVVAREAKERLDERLRTKRKSDPDRRRSGSSGGGGGGGGGSYSKRLSWASRLMSWKTSDLGECAVCLDHFRAGETLVHLPCAHRFHSNCLVPWLQNQARCPCCRMDILAQEITT